MVCKSPYVGDEGLPFGCGQCLPCRINKRRMWTHRIMLESYLHDHNSFTTLTYNTKLLPEDGSLNPDHVRDWLKRFREKIKPKKIRYYLCGEYGEKRGRPHYHVAIFGHKPCDYLTPQIIWDKKNPDNSKPCPCEPCMQIYDTWKMGMTFNGRIEQQSAQYVANYVTKKMSKDERKALGLKAEFTRMSNRPGIGADAMKIIAETLDTKFGEFELIRLGDVPDVLKHGGKPWPLGRYLKQQLRLNLGREKETPQNVLHKLKLERSARIADYIDQYGYRAGKILEAEENQKIRNLETKFKIRKGGNYET